MSLADKVIQANEQEIIEKQSGDRAPEGYYTDDLGFWVEQDIRRHKSKFAKYIYFRCKKLNRGLHIRDGIRLYNGPKLIRNDPLVIASLARLPENIPKPTANWVFDELSRWAPKLDKSKIEIAPGWLWDLEKQEIIKGVIKGGEIRSKDI